MDFWEKLFDSEFMPHGHCYMWQPEIMWLHAISDGLITLAYAVIPIVLAYFVKKRQDLAFRGVFLLFGAFILLCGATHALEIWSIWHGTYRLTGVVKAMTGLVSIGTAGALVYLLPQALRLPSPKQLRQANEALLKETKERLKAEAELATQEKEQLFRAIVGASPNGILLVSRDGIIEVANRAAEFMFHYAPQEMDGLPVNALISENFRKEHTERMAQFFELPSEKVMAGGRELHALGKNGEILPVEIGLSPLNWKNQSYVLVSTIDISERHNQKNLLVKAQQRFDRAVEGALEGLWEWQLESNEVWMRTITSVRTSYLPIY